MTFSVATTINAYYTAALTPAVAALLGTGAAAVWSARGGAAVRLGIAAVLAGTTGYAAWLLSAAPGRVPGWLVPAVFAVGLAGVVIIAGSMAIRGTTSLTAALAAGLLSAVLAPAVASALLVMHHEGAFDTPFESARVRNLIDVVFLRNPAQVALTISRLESFSGCAGSAGHPDGRTGLRVHRGQRPGSAAHRRIHRDHSRAHPGPVAG